MPGVRLLYTDSTGPNIVYLTKLGEKETIYLNFFHSAGTGKLEDFVAIPEITQLVNSIKKAQ